MKFAKFGWLLACVFACLVSVGCTGSQVGGITGGALGGGGGAAIGRAADKHGYLGPVLGGAIGGAVGSGVGQEIGKSYDAQHQTPPASQTPVAAPAPSVSYSGGGDSPALEAARTGEAVVVESGAQKWEYLPSAPDKSGTVRVKEIFSVNGEIKRTTTRRIRP